MLSRLCGLIRMPQKKALKAAPPEATEEGAVLKAPNAKQEQHGDTTAYEAAILKAAEDVIRNPTARFSSGGRDEPEAAPTTSAAGVKLRMSFDSALSRAGGLLVPRSFLIRDQGYRQRRLRTVEPTTEGMLRVRKVDRVFFGGTWEELACVLRNGALKCSHAGPAGLQGSIAEERADVALPAGAAVHHIKLSGAHLVVDHNTSDASKGFKIVTNAKETFQFQAGGHEQLLSWLQAFSSVPGLYRRPDDYFSVGPLLGKGATCKAYECTSLLTGREFVLKLRADVNDMDGTRGMHNELRILQKCSPFNHPAIPHLEDYFYEQNGKITVVMERFRGGELFSKIMGENHFSEQQAHHVFRQIAEGVEFLHSQGIAHRDLKPSNLLIREAEGPMSIAIIDYDLAKVNYADVWQSSTPCGTTPYMAPEIVRSFITRDTTRRRYSTAVDMWSLGCVLHVLLTGKRAFDGKEDEEIKGAIARHEMNMTHEELRAVASPEAVDLVMQLLAEKPEDRLTAAECLKHQWVVSDPAKLPQAPLPSPGILRNQLTSAEVEQLSSGSDAELSHRTREKLRRIVLPKQPPEGPVAQSRRGSLQYTVPPEQRSAPEHLPEKATKRNMDIEGLKLFLEETATLVSPAEGAEIHSPGPSLRSPGMFRGQNATQTSH